MITGKKILLAALLGIPSFAAGATPDCVGKYSELEPLVQTVRTRAEARVSDRVIGNLGRTVNTVRDGIRKKLQKWQSHPYPVVAMDDATPVKAHAFAKNAFGDLSEELKQAVNIDEVNAELRALLDSAREYPQRVSKLVDDAATDAAQAEILSRFRTEKTVGIETEVPVVRFENGKPTWSSRQEYWGTDVELDLSINDLRKSVRDKTESSLFRTSQAEAMALDQKIALKKLETFRHQLLREKSRHPGVEIPEETKKIFDEIDSLFKKNAKGEVTAVVSEIRPPNWTEDRIHWMQLEGEVKSLFYKQFPKMLEDAQSQKVVQYVKGLEPEERRALGLETMAEAAGILKQTKWFRVLLPTTTAGAAFPAATFVTRWLKGDEIEKEKCAAMSGTEFDRCVTEYLQAKFPGIFLDSMLTRESLMDPKSHFKDERLAAEVADIAARADRIASQEKYHEETESVIGAATRRLMKSAPELRDEIVETKDDAVFRARLLGTKEDGSDSILAFDYPTELRRLRPQITAILNAEPYSEEQANQLNALRKTSPALTDTLESFIDDRERFKDGGAAPMPRSNKPQQRGNKPQKPQQPQTPDEEDNSAGIQILNQGKRNNTPPPVAPSRRGKNK